MRMLVAWRSRVSHVSSNARTEMSCSFSLTSSSFQKYSWRPCTHSKYETTTPPPFASTSGRITTPASSRMSSACGVVAGKDDQLLVRDPIASGEGVERPALALVGDCGGNVDALLVVDAAGGV